MVRDDVILVKIITSKQQKINKIIISIYIVVSTFYY